MSRYTAVPAVTETLGGLAEAVRALKASVEILAGMHRNGSVGAPQVFLQATQPTPPRGFLVRGDLWINDSANTLSFWTGQRWQAL